MTVTNILAVSSPMPSRRCQETAFSPLDRQQLLLGHALTDTKILLDFSVEHSADTRRYTLDGARVASLDLTPDVFVPEVHIYDMTHSLHATSTFYSKVLTFIHRTRTASSLSSFGTAPVQILATKVLEAGAIPYI